MDFCETGSITGFFCIMFLQALSVKDLTVFQSFLGYDFLCSQPINKHAQWQEIQVCGHGVRS